MMTVFHLGLFEETQQGHADLLGQVVLGACFWGDTSDIWMIKAEKLKGAQPSKETAQFGESRT